ncbi:MAG: hypothetical protein AAF514_05255, partial [Verrucomicrobiota bacterium]
FDDVQVTSDGFARLEQAHACNDASPLKLVDCSGISISDLELAGSGNVRPDGAPPQQNGMRIAHCDDVSVVRCHFLTERSTGTMKHAITILDGCENISVRNADVTGTRGGSIISGSADWPHPSDPPVCVKDPCAGVLVEECHFHESQRELVFEGLTSRSQIRGMKSGTIPGKS